VRGPITFPAGSTTDFVVVRPNGAPLYTFVNPVDDALMGVTHVLRGEDLLSSTPRQIALYTALIEIGVTTFIPRFGHLPYVMGEGNKKLSKRDPESNLFHHRERGFIPEGLLNYLSLLGWSIASDRDIFSRAELIEAFDIVDVIPVNGGQSPGNLPGTATVYGIQWTSTFNFDPLGIPGAKLDLSLQFQKSRLTDPLTGARRPINENNTRQITATFRHDIPHTDLAYGAEFFRFRQSPLLRLDERWHFIDRPGSLGAYVEHKDVFGLTVRATVDNLLRTDESFGRRFYDGLRTNGVLFTENRDRYYGPIFTLTISGTI